MFNVILILTGSFIPVLCSLLSLTISLTSRLCLIFLATARRGEVVGSFMSVAGNFWDIVGIFCDTADKIWDVTANFWDVVDIGLS